MTGVRSLVAAAAIGMGLSAVALGQPASPPQNPPAQPAAPRQSTGGGGSPYGPTFDVSFNGGTLAEYVAAVQAAAGAKGHSVNVVVPAEAEQVPVPRMAMRSVTAQTALQALRWAFAESSDVKLAATEFGSTADGGSSSFAVQFYRAQRMLPTEPRPDEPVTTDILSIRDASSLLGNGDERAGAERVIQAVDAALSLQGPDTEPPQVKFHPDSSILVVRGTKGQVRTVREVVEQLSRDVAVSQQMQLEAAQRIADARAGLESARIDLETATQRREMLKRSLETAEAHAQAGHISQHEVAQQRQEMVEAEAGLKKAEARIRQLMEAVQLADLQGTQRAARVLVIYEATDLKPFAASMREAIARMTSGKAAVSEGGQGGQFIVTATPEDHAAIVSLFNLARQLKANDPSLKGLTVEEVMSGAKKEGEPSPRSPK